MAMRNYRGPTDDKRGLSVAAIKEEVEDMGFASNDAVPTRTSQLNNDSGYITKSDLLVTSVNGKIGDVTIPVFSGKYSDLVGLPTLFNGDYNSLTNKPTLFSKSYNDLTDKPTLFSGNYNDLTNKPTLFKATDQAVQRVRYYSVVTNSSGVWTLDLTNEGFTKVLDVQVQAVTTPGLITGVRQAGIGPYTETTKIFTGMATSVSAAGVITLSSPTTVRVRVEGT